MMRGYLGIDTSNYTTSCAVCRAGKITQQKRLLPVPPGQVGLRQSDAVFSHVKALGELMETLRREDSGPITAIGVSERPRDAEGSYMPCFCSGLMAARTAAAALGVPLYRFSHQAGHVAAALYGAGRLDLIEKSFVAFHLSGGTTESVWVRSLLAPDLVLLTGSSDLNAGQVVDRAGHLLGLGFPAGPALDALAQQSQQRYRVRIKFHEGQPCLSGVENQCADMLRRGEAPADIARYCLDAVLAALKGMVDRAREQTGCDTLLFAGGVMSNSVIRPAVEEYCGGIFAPRGYSCDNAAGIALLTALRAGEAAE